MMKRRQQPGAKPKKDFLRAYQPSRSTLNDPDTDAPRGKKGLFKRWGWGNKEESLSVEGEDGSHAGKIQYS